MRRARGKPPVHVVHVSRVESHSRAAPVGSTSEPAPDTSCASSVDADAAATHSVVRLEAVVADSYRTLFIPRSTGARMKLGVIDLTGTLRVSDPVAFLGTLAGGLGRAQRPIGGQCGVRRGTDPEGAVSSSCHRPWRAIQRILQRGGREAERRVAPSPRPASSPKYRETFAISLAMEQWRETHGED